MTMSGSLSNWATVLSDPIDSLPDSWTIAASPVTGTVVARGRSADGVNRMWRSTDNCATWTNPTYLATQSYRWELQAMPSGRFLLMSVNSSYRTNFYSDDDGATWATLNTGFGANVSSVAFDEQNVAAFRWASSVTSNPVVFLSTDGGDTFVQKTTTAAGAGFTYGYGLVSTENYAVVFSTTQYQRANLITGLWDSPVNLPATIAGATVINGVWYCYSLVSGEVLVRVSADHGATFSAAHSLGTGMALVSAFNCDFAGSVLVSFGANTTAQWTNSAVGSDSGSMWSVSTTTPVPRQSIQAAYRRYAAYTAASGYAYAIDYIDNGVLSGRLVRAEWAIIPPPEYRAASLSAHKPVARKNQ